MLLLLSKYLPNLGSICPSKSDHSFYVFACEHFTISKQAAYFFLDADLMIVTNTTVIVKKIYDLCLLKKKTSRKTEI